MAINDRVSPSPLGRNGRLKAESRESKAFPLTASDVPAINGFDADHWRMPQQISVEPCFCGAPNPEEPLPDLPDGMA